MCKIMRPAYFGEKNGVIEVFYPETNQWDYSLGELIPKRYFYGYTSYENKAYFIGGQALGEPTDLINILQYTPVGQKEIKTSGARLTVFPNPCSDIAHLKFVNGVEGTVICELISITGQKVLEVMSDVKLPGTNKLKIDLSYLPAGVYFCMLKTENGINAAKLIKR